MTVTTGPATNFQVLTTADKLYVNTTFSWAELIQQCWRSRTILKSGIGSVKKKKEAIL